MSIDCQWIAENLEAVCADGLAPDERGQARKHIEDCGECRREIQDLNAIDPLIKKYFQQQHSQALNGHAGRMPALSARKGVLGLGAVATALVTILLVFVSFISRTPQTNTGVTIPSQPQVAVSPSVEPPASITKTDRAGASERAKPSAASGAASVPAGEGRQPVPALGAAVPDFLVTDPAGYSRTLQDYRGHILLVGVWSTDEPESAANLERLYKAFASDEKLRFIGVSDERQSKPANTTFPIVYNQGSSLLNAKPGDFVLLDESGSVRLRGSLVQDYDTLAKALRGQ